jgi:hypothetical protein
MNKRIKELLTPKLKEWGGDSGDNFSEELEKFAELIVRECAQVCRDQPNVYALKADRDNCAIAIEQHFGVEE